MTGSFELDRFVAAQQGVMDAVRNELRRGRKTTHWMWFVFPQVAGLGRSATARRFAIGSEAEARAYLAHPVLGPRLAECSELLLLHAGSTPERILGSIDAVKLRSSMTLFDRYAADAVYDRVLAAFYGAERDPATLAIVDGWSSRLDD